MDSSGSRSAKEKSRCCKRILTRSGTENLCETLRGMSRKDGKRDGPDAADLGIHPAKLSDPVIRQETDGELFWKITVGKKPMPNYGTRLSPTDRWNVINYLRSLARR
jgi:hypothetical protein